MKNSIKKILISAKKTSLSGSNSNGTTEEKNNKLLKMENPGSGPEKDLTHM